MQNNHFSIWRWLGTGLIISLLTGCVVTQINRAHPQIQSRNAPATEYAKVYFIRPGTEHMQGFPDNPLKILVNGEKLLELGKAEYTLLHLKPHQSHITLENLTQLRGRWEVETMRQSRDFNFAAGQTYFLVTRPVDGEFRGVHFMPELVLQVDAKTIAKPLRAVGQAKRAPIDRL